MTTAAECWQRPFNRQYTDLVRHVSAVPSRQPIENWQLRCLTPIQCDYIPATSFGKCAARSSFFPQHSCREHAKASNGIGCANSIK